MIAAGAHELPITLEHADAVQELPLHHRDPFDRLLIAQAMVEDAVVISADAAFDAYPVRRRW
jgi:PIN domain nuclease of toxin-antitoxin system